jgi:hypothetical protein
MKGAVKDRNRRIFTVECRGTKNFSTRLPGSANVFDESEIKSLFSDGKN